MKKKIVISVIAVLLILNIGVVYYFVSTKDKSTPRYEESVNKITEIDYSSRQEELNQIVEDGMMNVQYSPSVTFDGTVSEDFTIKNIKNNKFPIMFEIIDENERSVYSSDKIELGYELNSIELDKKLSEGVHNCKIKIGYAEEGNVASVFPIVIEVR